MPLWMQHAVVLLLVAGALAYLGASAWRALAARKGRNCCGGKGCARADDMKRRLETARKRDGGTPSRT